MNKKQPGFHPLANPILISTHRSHHLREVSLAFSVRNLVKVRASLLKPKQAQFFELQLLQGSKCIHTLPHQIFYDCTTLFCQAQTPQPRTGMVRKVFPLHRL